MLRKIICALFIISLIAFLAGCEKREYHKHVEKQQHDVVIDEGPVVE